MATTAQSTTWLIFSIGRVACAVPALAVETIALPPEQLTALPGSDAGRPGLFRYGHETVAAIDLRYRFGLHDADHRSGRLLLGRIGTPLCGFWVDAIVGMVDSHELAPTTLPPELPHNVFTAALLYRKEIVLCSDLVRLHAMRDAGATLQRMVQPEPAPLSDKSAQDEATVRVQHATAVARPEPTIRNTMPGKEALVTPTTAQGRDIRQPTSLAHQTAQSHRPAATRPASERAATPRQTERTTITPRPATPPSPVPGHTLAAAAARPSRQPAPARPPTPSVVPADHAESARWQDSRTTASAPVPEETTGNGIWLVALLMALVAAGGGWYMFGTPEEKPQPVTVTAPAATVVEAPAAIAPQAAQPAVVAPVVPEPEPVSPSPDTRTLVAGQGIAVQQDSEGITIVIERARPETVTAPPVENSGDTADTATASAAIAAEPATEPETEATPAPVPEPQQMYVHTVVRGDTLWDIAEHYLDDPWRYKDLAQLNRIKNPDLIYPGDKIRIIIR